MRKVPPPQTLSIGLIGPFTGGSADFGVPMRNAMQQAVDEINAVYILIYSLFSIRDGNLSGPAIKAALATKARTYYGVVATYEQPFSVKDKDATTQNMLVLGMVKNGAVTFAYPEDAKRNLFVQRKQ